MKIQRFLAAAAAVLPTLLLASPRETLDLAYATQQFNDVALAPDGRHIAWAEARPNADRTPTANASIYLCDEHGISWSPDGSQLAFLSDRQLKQRLQLYVAPAAGGTRRMLTSLSGYLEQPRWSPDGRTVALLNIAETQAAAGAVEPAAHETGEVAEHVAEARLVLVDAATGAARAVSPPGSYVYEYDWSPASRQIAFISAPGSGDSNWWIARLRAVDTATGAVRELYRRATATGGSPACARSTPPPEPCASSTGRRRRSPSRAGRPTAGRSPSSRA